MKIILDVEYLNKVLATQFYKSAIVTGIHTRKQRDGMTT